MMSTAAPLLWTLVPLLVAFGVMVLDASPSLFLYDSILPKRKRFQSAFQNQTIWVTGASSGIGLELLCLLIEAQTKHVIISSRQQPALEASVATCRSRIETPSSTKVSFITYDAASADMSARDIVVRVLALTDDQHLDRVVFNAGIYQLSPALSSPVELSRRILRVNYESPTELAVALLQRQQQEQHPLHIIVVASILSRGAHALVSSYTASKHALRAFFHTLATETSSSSSNDVRIDVACPAGTATPLWHNSGVPEVDQGQLMSARRVAWLILTGATGPYVLFWETWMGSPIQLAWTTMASYTTSLFQANTLLFGWCRMQFWERYGTDVVDPFTLLRALFWRKVE